MPQKTVPLATPMETVLAPGKKKFVGKEIKTVSRENMGRGDMVRNGMGRMGKDCQYITLSPLDLVECNCTWSGGVKSLGPRARFSVVGTRFTFLLLLSIRLSYFSGK